MSYPRRPYPPKDFDKVETWIDEAEDILLKGVRFQPEWQDPRPIRYNQIDPPDYIDAELTFEAAFVRDFVNVWRPLTASELKALEPGQKHHYLLIDAVWEAKRSEWEDI